MVFLFFNKKMFLSAIAVNGGVHFNSKIIPSVRCNKLFKEQNDFKKIRIRGLYSNLTILFKFLQSVFTQTFKKNQKLIFFT